MAALNRTALNNTYHGTHRLEQIFADRSANGLTVGDAQYGGDGNDVIRGNFTEAYGGRGDDTLKGNHLAQLVSGGQGNDIMSGGLTYEGGVGQDLVHAGAKSNLIFGQGGGDYLQGGRGADSAYGGNGDDILLGGQGGDRFFGGRGADELVGDTGNDVLSGGAGSDRLYGGLGADTLRGGEGADVFSFANYDSFSDRKAPDLILDFTSGVDKLEFRSVASPIHYIGTAAFSGDGTDSSAEVRFDTTSHQVQVDWDGTGDVDFRVQLQTSVFAETDLILIVL
jgi:Ca2+-binding RTX toxin-like protein